MKSCRQQHLMLLRECVHVMPQKQHVIVAQPYFDLLKIGLLVFFLCVIRYQYSLFKIAIHRHIYFGGWMPVFPNQEKHCHVKFLLDHNPMCGCLKLISLTKYRGFFILIPGYFWFYIVASWSTPNQISVMFGMKKKRNCIRGGGLYIKIKKSFVLRSEISTNFFQLVQRKWDRVLLVPHIYVSFQFNTTDMAARLCLLQLIMTYAKLHTYQ